MPEPVPTFRPRSRRRTIRNLLILILLLAGMVLILPALLSTAPARNVLLAQVSRQTGLVLDATRLRFSWLSGLDVQDLQIARAGVFTAKVEKVTVEKGLLAILRDHSAGLVSVEKPEVVLAPGAGRPPAPRGASSSGTDVPGAGATLRDLVRFDWPAWTVSLRIQDGIVTMPAGLSGKQEKIDTLLADASLASRPPRLEVKASARNSSTGGRLDLKLLSTAPSDTGLTLDDIRHEGVLDFAGMQIQPLLMLLPSLPPGASTSEGQAGATLRFRGNGISNLSAQGAVDVDDLLLRGVFPAGDEPLVDRLQIAVQGAVTNGIPTNLNVNITTPFLRMQVNQDPRAAGIGDRLNLIAALDVPSLATLLPRTMRLRPDVVISSGNLQLRGQLELGSNIQVRLLAQLPDLKGRMGGEPLALDEPVSVEADVRWGADGLDMKMMRLRSGFANLEASGRPGQLSATGSLDLAKASAQAGTFMQLGPRTLGGVLRFSLGTRWTEGDLKLEGVSVKADALGLLWATPGGPAIRNEDVALEVSLNRGPAPDWSAAAVSLTASNRNVSVAAGGNGFDLGHFPGAAPRMTVTARADLGGLSKWFPGMPALEGVVVLAPMQAVRADRVWQAPRIRLLLSGLRVPAGTVSLLPGGLDIETVARWDQAQGQLELREFSAAAGSLRLQAPRTRIPLSPLRAELIEGSATFDADVADLLQLIRPMVSPEQLRSADGNLRVLASASDGLFSAAVNIGGMRLDAPWLARPVVEPAFSARATVAVSTNGGWRADAFELNSSALGVVGSAVLTAATPARGALLEVAGDLSYDLATLAGFVPGFSSWGIELAGKDERAFRVGIPMGVTTNGQVRPKAAFEVDLAAEKLGFADLVLQDLKIPARLSEDRLSVDATARLGDSALSLFPRVSLGTKPVLNWALKPPVLENLPLTDALAGQLLSRIHPIFKGASGLKGRASLHLDRVQVPMDATWRKYASFQGRLVLANTSLRADGWFDEILDLARVRERTVDLGSQTITFTCEKGRIDTSPLQASIGKINMLLRGGMGLDRSLDYSIDVPVTEDLVGKKVFEYLPGKQITLPLGGTLDKPRIDRDRFLKELERLTREAGTKALENTTDDLLRKLIEKNLK
ncbi:MAG: AsmA-like C-terminal region-containing protein [Kiritimatiellia bacterium]